MMRLNIIHRPETGERFPLFLMEQEMAHERGLRTTVLMTASALFDRECVSRVRDQAATYGDEIGLSFHSLQACEALRDVAGYGMDAIWLYGEREKRRIVAYLRDRYRDAFGCEPRSAGAYHMDASLLRIMEELLPEVKTVVAGCFEEGVRVFHGCNNSWYLFNEGMPWNPWYPSRTHSLRPAADPADGFDIVAIPHLVRDMALSYEGRNDFWASHPPNVIRAMGNDGTLCPYDRNLVDQYRLQEKYNGGRSYYTTFVSVGWLTWNHNSEYEPEVAQTLYRNQLDYFRELKDSGDLEDLTMGEYGAWHRSNIPVGGREVYLAKEMMYGSRKHYIWYGDSQIRALVDAAQGGSIGDLRPYVAQVPVETGPDKKDGMFGSYPYVIQSQHRTGSLHHYEDGARTTFTVRLGEETRDAADLPLKVKRLDASRPDSVVIELTPAVFEFRNGVTAVFIFRIRFERDGRIVFLRRLESVSDPSAALETTEYVKACPGKTEYPEDLSGIGLYFDAETRPAVVFAYRGRSRERTDAVSVAALIPSLGARLELASLDGTGRTACVGEGHLFNPYFTLSLRRRLEAGEESIVCLQTSSATAPR